MAAAAADRRSYLQRIESLYNEGDGYSISLLLSLADLHFVNDNLCVANPREIPVPDYVSHPLDEIVSAHLR
jgi:hypothetical protein